MGKKKKKEKKRAFFFDESGGGGGTIDAGKGFKLCTTPSLKILDRGDWLNGRFIRWLRVLGCGAHGRRSWGGWLRRNVWVYSAAMDGSSRLRTTSRSDHCPCCCSGHRRLQKPSVSISLQHQGSGDVGTLSLRGDGSTLGAVTAAAPA